MKTNYLSELVPILKELKDPFMPFDPEHIYFCSNQTQFMLYAYRNWAIDDLIERVEEEIDLPFKSYFGPINFIEKYRERMDDFACKAKTEEANLLFSIAYDLGTEVLDILISRRENDDETTSDRRTSENVELDC